MTIAGLAFSANRLTAGITTGAPQLGLGSAAVAANDVNMAALHFRYRISGGDPPWRPVQVFDDGSKVYVQFPPGIAQGDSRRCLSSARRAARRRSSITGCAATQ
jgi:uncharacterized Zn-binding protein involved in type VI secretion